MAEPTKNGGTEKTQAPVLQNQKTVYIEKRGEDGKTYSGDFTFKRLTLANIAQVGAEIARLNGGNPVDETTEFINTMLAHFKYGIVVAPSWWNPNDLYDIGVVKEVFDKLMEHERSFRSVEERQVPPAPAAG